jgi:hypothetical protein
MTEILILTAAAPLLAGLLFYEKRDSTRGLLLTKPFLSALFVVTALTGPQADPGYFRWILTGLLFCLAVAERPATEVERNSEIADRHSGGNHGKIG